MSYTVLLATSTRGLARRHSYSVTPPSHLCMPVCSYLIAPSPPPNAQYTAKDPSFLSIPERGGGKGGRGEMKSRLAPFWPGAKQMHTRGGGGGFYLYRVYRGGFCVAGGRGWLPPRLVLPPPLHKTHNGAVVVGGGARPGWTAKGYSRGDTARRRRGGACFQF